MKNSSTNQEQRAGSPSADVQPWQWPFNQSFLANSISPSTAQPMAMEFSKQRENGKSQNKAESKRQIINESKSYLEFIELHEEI